jgi:uncharacterized protein YcnI
MKFKIVRTATAAASSIFLAGVLVATVMPSAAGHAIIDLEGNDAVAGTTSVMKLEIQHGCSDSLPGVVEVQAFVGKPWRKIRPLAVAGWSTEVSVRKSGGYQITWKNLGQPGAFGTPVFFPLKVSWPKKAGTYGMTVLQLCPGGSTLWNTEFTAATADAPSPPLTPLPEVQVKKPS